MVAPRRSVTVGAVKRIKATYPSTSDIPALVCVNTYDVHGSQGKPSTKASDYQPASDSDNDVTNSNPAFTLTPGGDVRLDQLDQDAGWRRRRGRPGRADGSGAGRGPAPP